MALSRGSETSRKSFPGSFPTGTPSFEILQNPSSLFTMLSAGTNRVLFRLSSFFFSDGYLNFPVLLAPHIITVKNGFVAVAGCVDMGLWRRGLLRVLRFKEEEIDEEKWNCERLEDRSDIALTLHYFVKDKISR